MAKTKNIERTNGVSIKDYMEFFCKDYPLIKLFEYDEDVLIYDAKPHFAFIVSYDEMYVLIDFLQEKSNDEIIKNNPDFDKNNLLALINRYQELLDCGVFIKGSAKEVSPVDKETLEKQIRYYDENILLRIFCLEVTEDCNYRCKYCPNTLTVGFRQHTKTYMNMDIAQKSIDYYFKQYVKVFNKLNDERKALILDIAPPSFVCYGGEPLLNFDVILNSVTYFKNLPWHLHGIPHENMKFSMNTNLSIMDDNILRFLVENNIILTVSIDGTKEEHDKNRVFLNGRGTFEVAYSNLMKIKEYDFDYFKKRVAIFGVYTKENDIEKCRTFLHDLGTSSFKHFPADYKGVFVNNEKNLHEHYQLELESVKKEIDLISDIYSDTEKSKFSYIPDFAGINFDNPKGKNELDVMVTCPMAYDSLMVGANGNFHICHKTDSSMPIGNYKSGVNFDKIVDLFQKYNSVINNDACKSCWCVRFCKICSAKRMISSKFVNPTHSECEYVRLNTALNFESFIYLYLNYPRYYQILIESSVKEIDINIITNKN